VVGSWRRTVFQKYLAYWIEFQRREKGIDLERSEDDGKSSWWVENEGDSPFSGSKWGDEVAHSR
jgi:hypothetical protein